MVVRRPQIWRDDCIAVGFSQLLRTASLQALQTKMAVHDICPHISIYGAVSSRFVAGLRGRVSAPPPQPYFLQCMPGLKWMGTHDTAVPCRPTVSASGVSRPQRALFRGNARSQAGKQTVL